jgi:hypothetical protein
MTVGAVDKVEATQAGQTHSLGVKSEIYFKDRRHQAALKEAMSWFLEAA